MHVQGAQALAGWSSEPNAAAEQLVAAFWPGALTVVVARSERAGDFITGGQRTVALRCPDHPVARACLEALARMSGDPARGVAAPSANRFGRVSPTRALDVLAEVGSAMDPARDLVVDGGACAIGVESTIVDCTATAPRVLRLGAISQEQIDAVLAGDVERQVAAAAVDEDAEIGDVRAPGTLESHYAPVAAVVLIELTDFESFASGRQSWPRTGLVAPLEITTPHGWTRLAQPVTAEEYARAAVRSTASGRRAGAEGRGRRPARSRWRTTGARSPRPPGPGGSP